MIKSLLRYAKDTFRLTLKGNLHHVKGDIMRYFHGETVFHTISKSTRGDRENALHKVMEWMTVAQDATVDHGFASYHLARGWGSAYPETTGYIIPTLLQYSESSGDETWASRAVQAADFLLSIQRPSGGWQGGRMNENKPEVVFNTGQILRGLIAVHHHTGEEAYLASAARAARWLVSVQHPDGYWKKHALMDQARVYDSFVDAPLLDLEARTGDTSLREAALRNLEWIIEKKLQPNGWFADADNTVKRNDRPILHTLAYTLDGLIECDEITGDERYIDAARPGADVLKKQILQTGRLHGRYDRHWNGSEYFLCTGAAQMAIVWMKLYRNSGDTSYLEAADRALDILIHIQRRPFRETRDTRGALPGSFPVWGRYEPFAFPNWASKFFADALIMRQKLEKKP